MKRRIIILGAVVLLVVAVWSGGWLFVSGEIKKNIVALAEADGVTSPKVTCASLSVGGYPFRFDVTCTGASIVDVDLTANINELRASVLVYQPFHLLVFAHSPAEFQDAFTGARSRVDWKSLEGSVRLTDWRIARASVVLDQPVWTDTLAGETPIANAEHAEFHLVDLPAEHDKAAHTAALAVYSTVSGLVAPAWQIDGGTSNLEAKISRLPDDVRAFAEPGDPLQRWQAAGGQLTLTSFKGSDKDQSFDVDGLLALDPKGQANGRINARSRGVVETFNSFVPAEMRGLVLGTPAEDGTYNQTFTLNSGVILSGILPIGMIPPLW